MRTKSLRSKLLLSYLLTILFSSVILTCIMTNYFSKSMASQRDTLTLGTLNAICENIDTYLDDLNRLSALPYMDDELLNAFEIQMDQEYCAKNPFKVYEANQKISSSFNVALNNNRQEIKSVLLIDNNGQASYFDRYMNLPIKKDYDFRAQDWYKKIVAADGKAVFLDLHQQDYLSEEYHSNVFSVARLIKDPDTQKSICVLVADADDVSFNEILGNRSFGVSSIVAIQDSHGGLVYSTNSLSGDMQKQIFKGNSLIYGTGGTYMKIGKRISQTDWNVDVLMSYSEIESEIMTINLTTACLVAMEVAVAFLLFFIWSHTFTARFSKIRNIMRIAKSGDLSVRYHDNSTDEISIVGNDLNDMISKIENLVGNERKAIVSMKDAEFKAFQSQINPHFIYNVLNGFLGLNRLEKRDTLENSIISLSCMMRYIFKQRELSTLKEEFDFIENYCNLQKMRFGDRLVIQSSLDSRIQDFKIPKLLIQPLVENAIIHGIEPLDHAGTLHISAEEKTVDHQNYAVISVIDNGVGFDLRQADHGKKIGIKNVAERIKISFPNAVMKIDSAVGNGTQAVITIPLDDLIVLGNLRPDLKGGTDDEDTDR